jgi:hypothetical protein
VAFADSSTVFQSSLFPNKLPLHYYILPPVFFRSGKTVWCQTFVLEPQTYEQSGWFDWLAGGLLVVWLMDGLLVGVGWFALIGLVYVLHCLLVLA